MVCSFQILFRALVLGAPSPFTGMLRQAMQYHGKVMMTVEGSGSPAIAATFRLLIPADRQRNVGVLLLDLRTGTLYWRFVSEWSKYADEDDVEVLEALDLEFREQVKQKSGRDFFAYLSDTLSNSLQLVNERDLRVSDFAAATDSLYQAAIEAELD
jgi:hypothetical protein